MLVATDSNEVLEPVILTYRVPYYYTLLLECRARSTGVASVTRNWPLAPLRIYPRPRKLLLTG